jgi:hypothetical protein
MSAKSRKRRKPDKEAHRYNTEMVFQILALLLSGAVAHVSKFWAFLICTACAIWLAWSTIRNWLPHHKAYLRNTVGALVFVIIELVGAWGITFINNLDRPRITLISGLLKPLPDEMANGTLQRNLYKVSLDWKNTGVDPLVNTRGFLILEEIGQREYSKEPLSLAENAGRDAERNISSDEIQIPEQTTHAYITEYIKYTDSINGRDYDDVFYMQTPDHIDRSTNNTLYEISPEEAKMLEAKYKNEFEGVK